MKNEKWEMKLSCIASVAGTTIGVIMFGLLRGVLQLHTTAGVSIVGAMLTSFAIYHLLLKFWRSNN